MREINAYESLTLVEDNTIEHNSYEKNLPPKNTLITEDGDTLTFTADEIQMLKDLKANKEAYKKSIKNTASHNRNVLKEDTQLIGLSEIRDLQKRRKITQKEMISLGNRMRKLSENQFIDIIRRIQNGKPAFTQEEVDWLNGIDVPRTQKTINETRVREEKEGNLNEKNKLGVLCVMQDSNGKYINILDKYPNIENEIAIFEENFLKQYQKLNKKSITNREIIEDIIYRSDFKKDSAWEKKFTNPKIINSLHEIMKLTKKTELLFQLHIGNKVVGFKVSKKGIDIAVNAKYVKATSLSSDSYRFIYTENQDNSEGKIELEF